MKEKYDSMNMSNEFQNAHLNDPIPINVAMRSLGLANELAARFVLKERVVKERDSLGGFRIPQEVLKKRTNPSDKYEEELENKKTNQYVSYQNQHFQNESIENIGNLQGSYQYQMPKKYEMIDIGDINENSSANENLIKMLEAQVKQLKEESQDQLKTLSMQQNKDYRFGLIDQVDEPNVATKFLAANTDRVQAVKHVQTRQKPEYLSLEDLKREKEEHEKKLLQIENEYYGKKNQTQASLDEQALLRPAKKAKSIRGGIRREGYTENIPIDQTDQKYIKQYANYLAKKSGNSRLLYQEEWNETKIKSQNANGVVNRSDGQTGYIDQEDFSLYYSTILNRNKKKNDFERPLLSNPKRGIENTIRRTMRNEHQGNRSYEAIRSLYNSYSFFPNNSRSKSPTYTRQQNNDKPNLSIDYRDRQGNENNSQMQTRQIDYNSSTNLAKSAGQLQMSNNLNSSANMNNNSQINFIKMIFSMMDKDKIGSVSKTRIMAEMKLDENMIKELGFDNESDFQNKLNDLSTKSEQVLNEKEFVNFLINKGQMHQLNKSGGNNAFFSESQQRMPCYTDKNFSKSKMPQLPYQDILNNPQDNLPGLRTNTLEFLMNDSNKKRLKVLNESLRASGIIKKSKSQNQLTQSNYQNQNISFDNNNYNNFIEQFPSKVDINFTIPQPFDFLKKNYDERKLLKIQEILEERQRREDAVFKNQFHANSLNDKIFEGNLDNIIEKEKRERKKRTEKLKDEIVNNMKPFSFYAKDEIKYKEKISRECSPPKFQKFKANSIQWKSQVNMYEGLIGNDKQKREALAKERAQATLNAAHLPPRMEMHEKEKKLQEQTKKFIEEQESKKKVKPFTAKEIPNYTLLQEKFITTLEKQKKAAKPTVIEPFSFHEPKRKAELCSYLDNENDPQVKNPQKKPDVQQIIQKLQKKPEIEPASTKGLTLLMETRRKELEAKKKDQEKILHEDKLRKEKQERYKEKVQTVVKIREGEKKQKDKQLNEKAKQQDKQLKQQYKERLQRMNQRVANRPLLLEEGNDTNKIIMNQNRKAEIDEIVRSEIEKSQGDSQNQKVNIISSINNALPA